jgi:hypothetical protein
VTLKLAPALVVESPVAIPCFLLGVNGGVLRILPLKPLHILFPM